MATVSKIDRHHKILDMLSETRRALLPDLEREIEASRITIQRDLVELEERGLIKRFHGGAMLAEYDVSPLAHAQRMALNRDAKRRIAAAAAGRLRPGTFVAVDASSTAYYLSECVLPEDVTVITSGLDTFVNLERNRGSRRVYPILTGGKLQLETHTLVGPDALRTINGYHYETFVFSAFSLVADGVYESNEENAEVKRTFATRSEKRVLMLDASKFDNRGGARICGIDELDLVVTDTAPPAELAALLGDRLRVVQRRRNGRTN
jgi:DeoR family glycerol-3-phosphate regulon repressor